MESRFFTEDECKCKGTDCCAHTCAMDDGFMLKMDAIRGSYGKPLYVTSAFRCNKHNKNIGGVNGSNHTKGRAVDVYAADKKDLPEIAEIAKHWCNEVIVYVDKNFVHIGDDE